MFYKPQVAAALALVLIIDLGWPATAGYVASGSVLLTVNLLTLPGTLTDYLYRLPRNVTAFQTGTSYPWEQHVTIKAFWRLLLQGHSLGDATFAVTLFSIASAVGMAALLIRAAIAVRNTGDLAQRAPKRDRLIAATIVVTPLLMPFYFDYDLLLLAVPAVLFAAECLFSISDRRASVDSWTVAPWAALYAWLMVNAEFAGKFHINVSVILLGALAWKLIARVGRVESADPALSAFEFDMRRAA
jgi:hypothetical protein